MRWRGVVLVGSFIRKKNHTELGKEKNNPGHEGVFNFEKKRNKKNPPLNARRQKQTNNQKNMPWHHKKKKKKSLEPN